MGLHTPRTHTHTLTVCFSCCVLSAIEAVVAVVIVVVVVVAVLVVCRQFLSVFEFRSALLRTDADVSACCQSTSACVCLCVCVCQSGHRVSL